MKTPPGVKMALLKKNKKFLGTMLYHRRITLGMTLQDISNQIKRSVTAISKWETNKYQPTPKSIFMLAKTLKVKPEYFYESPSKN